MDTNQQTLMGNADNAVKSKAFGGSRSAIVDAVTNAQTAKNAGLLSATLRQQGYDTAANNAISSLSSAGSGLLNTGTAQSQDALSKFAGLMQGGAAEQQSNQAQLDSANKALAAPQDQAIKDLNLKLAALGMSPYPQSSTSTATTQNNPDWATTGLGILSLIGGLIP
jgi:hypothetical protein